MKNNRHQVRKPNLFWQWLKGIWSSFSRFVKRITNPNQGRRPSSLNLDNSNSPQTSAHPAHISPLVGISQFRNAESLTVGELMAKVQWRVPPTKTASSASVGSVKDEINWD
jgi:hypothetical protein